MACVLPCGAAELSGFFLRVMAISASFTSTFSEGVSMICVILLHFLLKL